jgi:hypothetical protein
MLPWAATLTAERHVADSKNHPDAHCLSLHPIQRHLHPQPRTIVQTPELLVILDEANDGRREIHLDGRPLPGNDVQPFWYGYSTGPASDRLKLTERIRRPTFGTPQIQMTIDDARTFTKPFSFTGEQRLMPDDELIEFVCGENNLPAPRLK